MAVTTSRAFGQAVSEPDHKVVVEVGAVAQRATAGGPFSWGGGLAAELAPFEHGLEFELGAAALGGGGEHEVSADLLVMKSWQLSQTVEFMVGAGPEVSWHSGGTSVAAEVVAHLMLWPWHNIGLFAEPGLSIQPVRNGERSLALAAGLLIGL